MTLGFSALNALCACIKTSTLLLVCLLCFTFLVFRVWNRRGREMHKETVPCHLLPWHLHLPLWEGVKVSVVEANPFTTHHHH